MFLDDSQNHLNHRPSISSKKKMDNVEVRCTQLAADIRAYGSFLRLDPVFVEEIVAREARPHDWLGHDEHFALVDKWLRNKQEQWADAFYACERRKEEEDEAPSQNLHYPDCEDMAIYHQRVDSEAGIPGHVMLGAFTNKDGTPCAVLEWVRDADRETDKAKYIKCICHP
jgi:hypothetical protein